MKLTRWPRVRSASARGRMRATWPRSPPSSQHMTICAMSGRLRREPGDERPEIGEGARRLGLAPIAFRDGLRLTSEALFLQQARDLGADGVRIERGCREPRALRAHRFRD